MAIKVGGTTVIDDSRNVDNIGTIKGLTYPSSDGTAGQFLKTDGAGNLAFQTVQTDPTLGSLTKTFASGESATITLTSSVSPTAVVAATKEVSQIGVSSKGTWDVNATASNYDLHNTAYSTTLTPSTIGYGDISAASYTNSSYQTSLDAEDFYMREDGLKFYLLDNGQARMQEFTLTTANDLSTASFVQNKDFNTIGGQSDPVGFTFKPDGTRVYVVSYGNDVVSEIHLSTAWDISTASFDANFSVASQTTAPFAIAFKSDGTRMYVLANSGTLFQYDLSTAWDVSTASYNSVSLGSIPAASAYGLTFSSTGDRLYTVSDGSDQDVSVWTLSTPWDISTATRQTGEDLNVLSQTGQYNYAVQFTDNGQNMYVYGNNSVRRVYKYSVPASNVLTLGTGSFASTDVGKNIQGNGGNVILTSASGTYDATGGSAFTDNSTIASGSWTMSGIKSVGDADGLGISYLFNGYASPNLWSYDNSSLETETISGITPSFGGNHQGFFIKPDGTSMYITNSQTVEIYQIDFSTPYDLSTASFAANVNSDETSLPTGIYFKPDGTKMYLIDLNGNTIKQYSLSTPWDLSTESYDNVSTSLISHSSAFGCFFKPDGTSFYVTSSSQDNIRQYNLSTAWDVSSITSVGTFQPQAGTGTFDVYFKPDGTVGYAVMNNDLAREFTLSTAWDITTASNTGNTFSFASQDLDARGLFMSNDGSKVYMMDNGAGGYIYQYSSGSTYTASGAYHIAVTNSGGQIDSQYWTDLNTMTADEAANSGTVHYAVSTDDRTTWSVIDNTNGTRPIVRNNSGTWQFNDSATYGGTTWTNSATNSEFYALQESLADGNAIKAVAASNITDWSYDSNQFNYTQTSSLRGAAWNADFTQVNYLDDMTVRRYNLSTAGDLSTATATTTTDMYGYSPNNQPKDIFFGDSGNILYYLDAFSSGARTIYQIALSTPYDISSKAGSATNTLDVGNQTANPDSMFFKPDGLRVYLSCANNQRLYEYTMTTAWDLSTATFTRSGATSGGTHALTFNSDGSVVYISSLSNNKIWAFSLSTPWDASTTSAYFDSLLPNAPSTQPRSLDFNSDHTKLYVGLTGGTPRFARFETANQGNYNRMNKTQLDAVTDPNHYTLGNTLDLMIALRVDSQTNNVPTSDGVTINYDAAALNQGAVLGTDYDYDIPANNKVRITSNAAQNLKIRVV